MYESNDEITIGTNVRQSFPHKQQINQNKRKRSLCGSDQHTIVINTNEKCAHLYHIYKYMRDLAVNPPIAITQSINL